MDRLVVMRTFVTVAKSSSFSGAARELGISGSLVSRHVADLEKQIGVRLVNRTARSVSLTEAGHRYSEFVDRILGEIDREDVELARGRDTAEGTLSIVCPRWIGTLELGDAIAAFSVKHPRIRLKFDLGGMSDRTYDFLDKGYDVAFHTRDLRDSNVLLRKITDLPFTLVASPDYVAKHGAPTDFADLVTRESLVHINDPVWRLGHGSDAVHHKVHNIAMLSNSYLVIQKLAVSGRGIALLPRRSVLRELESGQLVELLPALPPPDRALYAVHAPGGGTPERVKVFLQFMSEWFREHDRTMTPRAGGA